MISEKQIQTKHIKKLEKQGYYVVKIITCNKNGFPDVMALKDGNVKFFEYKSSIGKLRPLQKYRHKELMKQGFNVEVINEIKKASK